MEYYEIIMLVRDLQILYPDYKVESIDINNDMENIAVKVILENEGQFVIHKTNF